MLESMVGAGDGVRDALTRYSHPVSGAYYFVPSIEAIGRFQTAEDQD
jgi:porphyrinogen peroxidase